MSDSPNGAGARRAQRVIGRNTAYAGTTRSTGGSNSSRLSEAEIERRANRAAARAYSRNGGNSGSASAAGAAMLARINYQRRANGQSAVRSLGEAFPRTAYAGRVRRRS